MESPRILFPKQLSPASSTFKSENGDNVRYEKYNKADVLKDAEEPLLESEIRILVTKPHLGVHSGFFGSNGTRELITELNPKFEPYLSDRFGNRTRNTTRPDDLVLPSFEGLRSDLASIPDVNTYQHKKTIAQGMMDLALFSANTNQFRYVLENSGHHCYFPGIVLISLSLLFQVAVGVGLILNTRYNVKNKKEICFANRINNFTVVGIFLVTAINVFISTFGVTTKSTAISSMANSTI